MPNTSETNSGQAGSWVSLAEQEKYAQLQREYAELSHAYRKLSLDFTSAVQSVMRFAFELEQLRAERDALRAAVDERTTRRTKFLASLKCPFNLSVYQGRKRKGKEQP